MRWLLVAVVLGVASAAAAESSVTWRATRGSQVAGTLPGSFLLASDAAPGRYSVGEVVSNQLVPLPFRFEVTWRRLGPEAGRSMHILVAGGVVLIKSGWIAFYAYDDAAFASGEWMPIAGHVAHDQHVVTVTQDRRDVEVRMDGVIAARYSLAVARVSTHIGVGMKAAPGYRSMIYVRALAVDHLQ